MDTVNNNKSGSQLRIKLSIKIYIFTYIFIVFVTYFLFSAALTVYDMCKAIDHQIIIKDIHLLKKSGGKTDFKFSDEK